MMYCPECAVGIRGEHEFCPLCASRLQDAQPEYPADVQPPAEIGYEGVAERVRRKPWLIGMVTLGVLFIPGAISFIVDLLINRAATWSPIVLGALGLLLLYISLPSMVFYLNTRPESRASRKARRKRRFWMLMLLNALATWGYLLYLDRVDSDGLLNWAPDFGSLATRSRYSLSLIHI